MVNAHLVKLNTGFQHLCWRPLINVIVIRSLVITTVLYCAPVQ